MPLPGTLLLVAGAALLALKGSLRTALAVTVGAVLFVPDTLALPGRAMDLLPVTRIVVLSLAVRLAVDVAAGRLDRAALRPGPVHAALGAYLLVVVATGIALAPGDVPLRPSLAVAAQIAEQLVVFAAVLAVVRTSSDGWWIARALALALVAVTAIAAIERATGWSYAEWVLTGPGQREGVLGAHGLESRGGDLRVRGPAQFALGFAWVGAMLFPVLLAALSRSRNRALWAAPALVVATLVWSRTRSALPALALGVAVLLVASRFNRRLVLFGVVAALLATAALSALPGIANPFSSDEARASDAGRAARAELVLDVAADRPALGYGLGATQSVLGISGTDASYVLVYAEAGVLAAVALGTVVLVTLATLGRGALAAPRRDRPLAAACLAAAAVGFAGAATYDLFSVPGSSGVLWAVVALGAGLAERGAVAAPHRPSAAPRLAVVLPAVGAAAGLLAFLLAPRTASAALVFEALPVATAVHADGDVSHSGRVLAGTICERVERADLGGVRARCIAFDGAAGTGRIDLRGPSAAAVERAVAVVAARQRADYPGFALHPLRTQRGAVPSAPRTAPLWGAAAGLAAALAAPALRRPESPRVGWRVPAAP